MSHCAEFQIVGRVGNIKEVGSTLRVTIAASYSYKDKHGDWAEKTRWNEITIFDDGRQGYVERNIKKGDLVRATGVLQQTSWESNGQTQYGVTLACDNIGRLAKGPNHTDEQPADNEGPAKEASKGAKSRARQVAEISDIPF